MAYNLQQLVYISMPEPIASSTCRRHVTCWHTVSAIWGRQKLHATRKRSILEDFHFFSSEVFWAKRIEGKWVRSYCKHLPLPYIHMKALCVSVWIAAFTLMSTFSILCCSALQCVIWDYPSIWCYVITTELKHVPYCRREKEFMSVWKSLTVCGLVLILW